MLAVCSLCLPQPDGCIPIWVTRQARFLCQECFRRISPLFKTLKSMSLALWCQCNGSSSVMWSHCKRKKKFQSGYWSPAHMAALSNRCFSFVLLQSLGSEAQSQRGDSWCEPFSCYSQQTERRLQVENKHEPGSVLVDFLLLRYDKAVEEDMTDGTDCVL